MEWMVAPSYQKATIEKIDEENHKAFIVEKCDRCGGSGAYVIPGIFQGMCFQCMGRGVVSKWVKAYTEEEYEKYIKAVARAKEKKEEKRNTRNQELLDNSEANKRELLNSFGYEEEPFVYLVYGNDTYSIKDELKERSGRYSAAFNWYFTHETEVPEGYELVKVPFDEVYNWYPLTKKISEKENAKEVADAARRSILPVSKSEFVGEIKERLRDLRVTLTSCRGFDSPFGYTIVYTFKQGENVFIWMTTAEKDVELNHEYLLSGTVKKHEEYNGIKQTHLSRCLIKEVAQ